MSNEQGGIEVDPKGPGTPKSHEGNASVLPTPTSLTNRVRSTPYVTMAEVREAARLERDPRRRLLVEFLWRTGCRISEALALRAQDVDLHLRLVRLVTLKRRVATTRTIPLHKPFLRQLVASERPFPWTVRVAYGYVRLALERAGARATNPHALRHGHAIHALRELQAPLDVVSRALGHANISTTSAYLRATAEDVRRFYGSSEAW